MYNFICHVYVPPKKFMLIHYMQPNLDIHIMVLQEK